MKNILLFALLGLLSLSLMSCDKEQEISHSNNNGSDNILYKVHLQDGYTSIEGITVDQAKGEQFNTRGQNHSSNGHFTIQSGSSLSFSAMENNGGVHGQSHFDGAGNLILAHFKSDCIVVVDNQAYFGGEITQWEVVEGTLPEEWGVGWSMYFAVEDNGEGNNSESDELGASFFMAPPNDPPACDAVYNAYVNFNIPFNPGYHPTHVQVK